MILETVFGVLVDIVVWLVAQVQTMAGARPSGNFLMPAPLFQVMQIVVTAATAIYPAAFLWFLWRQVKA